MNEREKENEREKRKREATKKRFKKNIINAKVLTTQGLT